ncbi:heme exporter protein CcmD [Paracoccus sp. SCSIO 75233]|uniref:heme exporter protein CcmD n=1 Tax=Paracoccus sp. SCSIO 75233 TaxID=3017782 RepID=UPI0022F0999F|nr:heme exporter protein CcmD [Paracoccus sp. SCSIO 75233]WBU53692.1 heme exporter protein CcmD [Paracoccus sp. SCSIO 75233]
MIELGRHAGPVLWAWAISLALLAAIIAQSLIRNARARRALEAQERLMKDRKDAH